MSSISGASRRVAEPVVDRSPRSRRWGSFLCGLVLAPLAAWLVVEAILAPASPSGALILAGICVIAAGLLSAPFRRRRGMTTAGVALIALVVLARIILVRGDSARARLITLPDGGSSRLVSRVVEERDGALLAARLIVASGRLPARDARDLVRAMRSGYERMEAAEGALPTPAVATYLGLQSPQRFDTLIVEPEGRALGTVVFLHGFAGSFAVQCWQLAQAATDARLATYCPSIGPSGAWWRGSEGARTVEATIAEVERSRSGPIVLAGLSNGAIGASRLVHRFASRLSGLLLVSGCAPEARPPRGIPILLVNGTWDSMTPIGLQASYARRGGRTEKRRIRGGHMILLDRHAEVRSAIGDWLRRVAGQPPLRLRSAWARISTTASRASASSGRERERRTISRARSDSR